MSGLNEIRSALIQGECDEKLLKVYSAGALEERRAYLDALLSDFEELFGVQTGDISFFSAPGRTEVGGNHTDHNHGRVLAAAISLDAVAVVSKRDDGIINVKSRNYPMDTVDCAQLEPVKGEEGTSAALIRGVAARFKQLGYNVGGFDAATASQVLSGSGMSSSAAFEVLIGTILSHLYNDGKVDAVEIAKIAQYAENKFFGKPCGLMDQMACSVGSFVTIDFDDPEKPIVEKVGFNLAQSGYSLCIVDTKGSHSDLTDEYAAVRKEMEAVAGFFGKSVLRDVNEAEFFANISAVRDAVSDRAVLRAMHFFADNARVVSEVAALNAGDFDAFKALVIESGNSSYMYNQNVFTCKNPASQPVSLALAISEKVLKGKGAWRVHGGGFAGTIQAFVPTELVDTYTFAMKAVFGDDSCHILDIRAVGGTKLI